MLRCWGRATCRTGSAISTRSSRRRRSPRGGSTGRARRCDSGARYDAAIAPVAGGAMLPATYAGMRLRRRRFVLWASVWAHPRGGAKAALALPARAPRLPPRRRRRHLRRARQPLRRRYRGHDDDVFVAPQSVEAEIFGRAVARQRDRRLARRGTTCPADGPLVLYVGRLVEEKGIAVLLDAWRAVRAAHPQARLVAIGDGALAAERRSPRPPAPPARPARRASACRSPTPPRRVVTLPSIPTPRFREPWGLVCNEAMHQGDARRRDRRRSAPSPAASCATTRPASSSTPTTRTRWRRDRPPARRPAPARPASAPPARKRSQSHTHERDGRRVRRSARLAASARPGVPRTPRSADALCRTPMRSTTRPPRTAPRGRVSSRPRTRPSSASSTMPGSCASVLGDDVREVVLLAQPQRSPRSPTRR